MVNAVFLKLLVEGRMWMGTEEICATLDAHRVRIVRLVWGVGAKFKQGICGWFRWSKSRVWELPFSGLADDVGRDPDLGSLIPNVP